jgi:hypothetical protein
MCIFSVTCAAADCSKVPVRHDKFVVYGIAIIRRWLLTPILHLVFLSFGGLTATPVVVLLGSYISLSETTHVDLGRTQGHRVFSGNIVLVYMSIGHN